MANKRRKRSRAGDDPGGADPRATGPRSTDREERGFAAFLAARFLSNVAVQMQGVAVGWQVYELTGNPLDLGLVGLAQFLPLLLLSLPAGHLVDRFDRRRMLAACFAVEVACSGLLLAFTLAGLHRAWPVFLVLAFFGAVRAFATPASQAMLPNPVPPARLGRAVATNTSAFHIATIAGPPLGGFLYAGGAGLVYAATCMLLAASVLLVLRVRTPRMEPREAEPRGRAALLEGLRFVWSRPVVLGALSLDLFAVLLGGATALLPVFARDLLAAGPIVLGMLRAAPAVGAAATALLLARYPLHRRVGPAMFGGVFLFAAMTLVFGWSRDVRLSCAALALMGAGDMVSVYVRHMLVQVETPDAIRGRVSAVNTVFIGASNELGEFESGLAAAWLGPVGAVLAGGVGTMLVAAAWMRLFPELRRMDRFPRAEATSTG